MGVWTDEGEFLGRVQEILHTGGNDVYVVRDEEGTVTHDLVVELPRGSLRE